MKRGLVLSLCALTLAALSVGRAAAQTTANFSLNLRYTDPANPAEGGRWYLMAKTNATHGLAGVSAYLSNVNEAGIALGNPTANPQYAVMASTVTGSIANGGNPYADTINGNVNVVWGFDVGTSVIAGIGKGSGAGNIATDPLRNANWNNAALLVSGTFGAVRPTIVSVQANELGAATAGEEAVLIPGANITTTVRGDSLFSLGLNTPATAGLRPGDTNRDGAVGAADSATLFNNWAPAGTTKGWDTGDFNNDGAVGAADSAALFNNWNPAGTSYVAPQVAAVPEPASFALAGVAMLLVGGAARRRS